MKTNRLTENTIGSEYWFSEHSNYSTDICLGKLGQLEDIEEELGIDLVTLFKCLKNGVRVKGDNEVYFPHLELVEFGNGKQVLMLVEEMGDYRPDRDFYFEDYGKTWALTKEELL